MHFPEHELYTREVELLLEVEFYLSFHRGYMAMAKNVIAMEVTSNTYFHCVIRQPPQGSNNNYFQTETLA